MIMAPKSAATLSAESRLRYLSVGLALMALIVTFALIATVPWLAILPAAFVLGWTQLPGL